MDERGYGMAFWLRAGLVIGAIYYLSPLRLGEAPGPVPAGTAQPSPGKAPSAQASTAQASPVLAEVAGPILDALPDSVRARVVEAAGAEAGRALGTGLAAGLGPGSGPGLAAGLRTAAAEAGRPASRDTLTAHDRQPAWRGAADREAH